MAYEGRCLCGQVCWRAAGEPINVRICHCRLCQKATGGPYFARALFLKAELDIAGETTRFASSHRLERRSCPRCGTPMFAEPLDQRDRIAVSIATCDDRDALRPGSHIWTSSKLDWVRLDDDLPKFSERPTD
jgi:hypothetical protein